MCCSFVWALPWTELLELAAAKDAPLLEAGLRRHAHVIRTCRARSKARWRRLLLSASWRSGGSSQRQAMPQAAPGPGQPRPIHRLGRAGRPYGPCSRLRCRGAVGETVLHLCFLFGSAAHKVLATHLLTTHYSLPTHCLLLTTHYSLLTTHCLLLLTTRCWRRTWSRNSGCAPRVPWPAALPVHTARAAAARHTPTCRPAPRFASYALLAAR